MSVRREKRYDASGKSREIWLVDVIFRHPDGPVQRVRRVSRVQTKSGAAKLERVILNELESGTYQQDPDARTPTVASFAVSFLAWAQTNNKPSSYASKEYILRRHIVPFFGRRKLNAITCRHLELYKAHAQKSQRLVREGGFSATSINHHLTALRTMLRLAAEWKTIPPENIPRFVMLDQQEQEIVFLDFLEAESLRRASQSETVWHAMIVAALDTGLRLGELRALRWRDISFSARRVIVRKNMWREHVGSPKGNRSREVPLNDRVLEVLRRHPRASSELVFCNEDGRVLSEKQCQRAMQRMCKRAAITSVQWHGLRHSFASHLVMRGVSLKAVQELMGHKDIKETLRYSHLTANVRLDAVNALIDGNIAATQIVVA